MEPAEEQWPGKPNSVRQDVGVIVNSVIHPHELDECTLVWLPPSESPMADHLTEATWLQPGDESPTLWIRVIAQGEEWWYGAWRTQMYWDLCLAKFADQLESWVSETSFAWGQQRIASLRDHCPSDTPPDAIRNRPNVRRTRGLVHSSARERVEPHHVGATLTLH